MRRKIYKKHLSKKQALETLPYHYQHYDYSKVMGVCCENVVGYMPMVGTWTPKTCTSPWPLRRDAWWPAPTEAAVPWLFVE